MWQNWVTAILGLAILAVPFLNLASDTMMWTLGIGGLAVAVLAVWGALNGTPEGTHTFQTR